MTSPTSADAITIKDSHEGLVYNIETHEKPYMPFDMQFKPANDSVQVKSFEWYTSNPTKAEPAQRNLTESAEAGVQNGILFQRSDASNNTFVCLNVTDVQKNHRDELNKAMIIGIQWTIGKQDGETLSKAFSITPNTVDQERNNVWGKVQGSYYNISRQEITPSGGSDHGFTPPNNSSDNNNNSSDNSTSGMPTLGGNNSPSQTPNRGRGGLGTGAIAGIAVGAAALLAAALGILFFLRRRRGRGTRSTTALHRTHAAEREKLSSFAKGGGGGGGVAGGASASDAAIAPYRDDNSTLTNSHDRRRSSAATTGRVVVAPGEDMARDQQPSPPKTTTTTAAAAAAAAAAAESRHSRTGNGVSRHLVEEGMTAEEIRRLEEEEAQLDEEIQRANGRRR